MSKGLARARPVGVHGQTPGLVFAETIVPFSASLVMCLSEGVLEVHKVAVSDGANGDFSGQHSEGHQR